MTIPILAALLSGCGGGGGSAAASMSPSSDLVYTREQAAQHGTWTVLVYLDADNDLESAAITNFNQMEMMGSTKDVRVIVQMDRASGYDSSNDNWTDTRRYLITRNTNAGKMASVRLDDAPLGELDMANWHTLKDFVDWGASEFPADHYCLIIWDHGTGWTIRLDSAISQYKYIVSDETNGSGMNVTEIPLALTNVRIDVLAFDACLMQQLEVAYEMRNSAGYMVGSPGPEPSPGYDYSALLARLGSTTSPAGLCSALVEEYGRAYPSPHQGISQTAVDLSKITNVADAASRFADVLISAPSGQSSQLAAARDNALNYSLLSGGSERNSLDLLDYAHRCANALGGSASTAYTELEQAVTDSIVSEMHNPDTPSARGLAVYLPPPMRYDIRYRVLDLAQSTSWDEWIQGQRR
ncbi:MAG: clostripain-related cysteine peptidase [Armatimonadota bacterium]